MKNIIFSDNIDAKTCFLLKPLIDKVTVSNDIKMICDKCGELIMDNDTLYRISHRIFINEIPVDMCRECCRSSEPEPFNSDDVNGFGDKFAPFQERLEESIAIHNRTLSVVLDEEGVTVTLYAKGGEIIVQSPATDYLSKIGNDVHDMYLFEENYPITYEN